MTKRTEVLHVHIFEVQNRAQAFASKCPYAILCVCCGVRTVSYDFMPAKHSGFYCGELWKKPLVISRCFRHVQTPFHVSLWYLFARRPQAIASSTCIFTTKCPSPPLPSLQRSRDHPWHENCSQPFHGSQQQQVQLPRPLLPAAAPPTTTTTATSRPPPRAYTLLKMEYKFPEEAASSSSNVNVATAART